MSVFPLQSPMIDAPAQLRSRMQILTLPAVAAASPSRLLSLDVLRGFAMFWLIGGREWMIAAAGIVSLPFMDAVETQLTHPRWEGFVFWDFIMPLFLFLVGVSMPLAMENRLARGEKLKSIYARILRRCAVLWILGMVAQGSLLKYEFEQLEFFSNALQAIAVGYLVASIALLHFNLPGQIGFLVSLVSLYGALLMFVPFAAHPAGTLEQTVNLPRYLDEIVLGIHRRDHSFTWLATSLGFSATVLLGAMAGRILQSRHAKALNSPRKKFLWLMALGVTFAAAGYLWSYYLPLNRHLWTTSMILWTGGLSFMMTALFYAVIDVWGCKTGTYFFEVIGANALFAYLFGEVIDDRLSTHLFGNLADQCSSPYGDLLIYTGEIAIVWLILWYLYRNRTFLRA
jgi:predicted acyltransferase